MAGSRRYFKYTTDAGEDYSVALDESNGEATLNDGRCMPNRTANHPELPRSIRMRYILAESVGLRKLQRKFYIGDSTLIVGLSNTDIIQAPPYPDSEIADWVLVSYSGEKIKYPKAFNTTGGDTGLNDGDQGIDENT